jgi:phospholipid transport system transporter-binding protein
MAAPSFSPMPSGFVLPSSLTLAEAAAVNRDIQAAVARAPTADGRFVADASQLAGFDTGALAVLLEAARAARARGLGFQITAPPAKLAQLAALYGVAGLLGLGQASAADARVS